MHRLGEARCVSCRYNLHGLSDLTTCPECGQEAPLEGWVAANASRAGQRTIERVIRISGVGLCCVYLLLGLAATPLYYAYYSGAATKECISYDLPQLVPWVIIGAHVQWRATQGSVYLFPIASLWALVAVSFYRRNVRLCAIVLLGWALVGSFVVYNGVYLTVPQ